jgi:hypothetical protein
MTIFNEMLTFSFLKGVVKAYVDGSKKVKIVMTLSAIVLVSSILFLALTDKSPSLEVYRIIVGVLAGVSVFSFISFYAYQLVIADQLVKSEIKEVEDRVKEHPNEPTAAWELARLKLESYLNRNLAQIRWIFYWTVIIMSIGFGIIIYGIVKVYEHDANINATLITVISGILVEFIGATFLVVYKSTMEQAKDFMNVLERINAVGMSVQIIDRIEEDQQLKNKSGAEIAKLLLELYGLSKPK